jgi:hypothetical protein
MISACDWSSDVCSSDLFVLNFDSASDMLQEVSGKPVYLAMAMDPQNLLKIKPQNLLLNLPLARRS